MGSRGGIQADGSLGGESSPVGVSWAGGAAAIVRAAGPQLQKTGSLNKIQKNKDVH